MLVRDCEKCKHHVRQKWVETHTPANYHDVGFSHVYAWCGLHKKRCRDVRGCDVMTKDSPKEEH